MDINKNFTDRQKKRLYELVSEILFLTEEESAAIDHQIPMTQELFEKCVDHCAAIDAQFTLNNLLNEYPEFSKEYARKEEEKILILNCRRIFQSVQKKYGKRYMQK